MCMVALSGVSQLELEPPYLISSWGIIRCLRQGGKVGGDNIHYSYMPCLLLVLPHTFKQERT